MKLEFVAIPAKRAAETDYGYLDEGDEVLKCFDLECVPKPMIVPSGNR